MFNRNETPVNPNANLNPDPGFDPRQSAPMADGAPQPLSPADLSPEYILRQVEAIHGNTAYLTDAVEKIGELGGNDSIAPDYRAQAIGDIVKAREETNCRLIEFYTNLFYWQCPEARPEKIGDERAKQNYELRKQALNILGDADLDGDELADVLAKIINMN
ncbi:MAG: hypothetical protein DBY36_03205 [Clostridiales bacterium]|nr:MAG: hypothetical protein DBY36_03205 [Clostridiales bacterium]